MIFEISVVLKIVFALLIALVISFIATPLVKLFAQRVGAIDVPNEERRVHDHPIPRMGGLAIFIAFILSVVIFTDVNQQIQGILLGAVIVVIIGVIDDIVPLPALLKFVVQILAALVAVWHGVVIEVISNPNVFSAVEYLPLGVMAIPITVFWIVAITNSVNLIDGLDGLACGVSVIASITMFVIAIVLADLNAAIILAALTGACLGFLPYNMNPAKIFMGDTGALLLGFVLATVSVISVFKFYAIISFAVPFLVLGLPLFDTAFAFFRRILSGRNPMSPDRGHFHHRLIDMGLSQKQAVAILYSISFILGLAAVVITTSGEIKALLLIFAFCVAMVIATAVMRVGHEPAKPAQPSEEKTEEIPSEPSEKDAAEPEENE